MRFSIALLLVSAACGPSQAPAAAPTSASSSAPATSTSTSTPAPSPMPAPVPTGGSVLLGDVAAAQSFDPKPTLLSIQQPLVDCYNRARATDAELRGKMKVRVIVNQAGTVVNVEADPGPVASAPGMFPCVSDVLRGAHFAKPGGMATVTVPLLFRP